MKMSITNLYREKMPIMLRYRIGQIRMGKYDAINYKRVLYIKYKFIYLNIYYTILIIFNI